jgi:hypothetical protein
MAPAPWVSYARAGCNFGTVAGANTEFENTLPDVALVYGKNSPEAKEAGNPKLQSKATADFMGLAVHCARGAAVIKDSSGNIGFPGYNGMTGPNALAYTLDMQLPGVQVTDTYLSDLHESWTGSGPFGPGQPGYESQLRAENAAFGTFFSQLAAHGITRANTLFVITADEGDHFAGSAATPSGCNGVKIICVYSRIGEVNGNGVLLRLGQAYTQLEAPVGVFGLDTLMASTRGLASHSAGDATYASIESKLAHLGERRDDVAAQMRALLLGAAFNGRTLNTGKASELIKQGDGLLGAAATLAA